MYLYLFASIVNNYHTLDIKLIVIFGSSQDTHYLYIIVTLIKAMIIDIYHYIILTMIHLYIHSYEC